MILSDGIKIFSNYIDLLGSPDIDAVYIPLPNSMHFDWTKKALESNKHAIVEKPLVSTERQALELIKIAREKDLVLMETFQFRFHRQISFIKEILLKKRLGVLKKIDIKFGIPKLDKNDIRYKKNLLGGAYYDLGVYGLRIIKELFNDVPSDLNGRLFFQNEHEVDIGGNMKFYVNKSVPVDFDFGFDNEYQCSLEIWGSKGVLRNERIFTAPNDLQINTPVKLNNKLKDNFFADDQIMNLFDCFAELIRNRNKQLIENEYSYILDQACMVESTIEKLVKND